MKNRITMKDIAREAGVSVATVSHVINGTKNISKETSERVLKSIEKYNYVPDSSAKNLRKKKTKTAGLIVSSLPDNFVNDMIFGVEERAREMGYNLLLVNTKEDEKYEEESINLLHSNLVDGIILSPTSGDISYLNKYTNYKFPVVMVNRFDKKIKNIPIVSGDNYQLGFDATTHLLRHGHKKIGFIYSVLNVSTTEERLRGYKDALKQFDIPFCEGCLERGYGTVKGGADAVANLLSREKDITALFTQTDLMTVGAIGKIKEMQLRIPDDLAIIGFGDFPSAVIIEPPVTNIILPARTIGRTAFDVLINKIHNPDYMTHIQLPSSLIVRNSCGC
ncbi:MULTISPECIES: LacI family DNA-binding transcriptional regulator [Tepidanaerobacter]|uniref:LacI family transcriptional regulator n=1 Tax=Tepidanaerobacter syntrophicus TaxID=224999 RepID=A0A0U9HEV1_9FIRM|nr:MULTISPECIES: LacI family DNA-binding transcriptional regulator [Tepidanaerobacter]GAQ25344.1 LacI family transcriptional regulator [Tepidanaerobacter syntrophicus]GLI50891.1 LacI family transcriptional regulator [Tepidanaerobacter syntrophicus]